LIFIKNKKRFQKAYQIFGNTIDNTLHLFDLYAFLLQIIS